MGTSGAKPPTVPAPPTAVRAVSVTVPVTVLPTSFDIPVSWGSTPLPVDNYQTYVDMTALVGYGTAVVTGTPVKAGCTVHVTITSAMAVAVQIIVVGWVA